MLHFHFILTFRFLSHSSDTRIHRHTHTCKHERTKNCGELRHAEANSPHWAALFTAQQKSAQHQRNPKEIYRCSLCHPSPVSSVFVRCASSAQLGSWPSQCAVPPPISVLIKSHLIENNTHTHKNTHTHARTVHCIRCQRQNCVLTVTQQPILIAVKCASET